MDFWQNHPRKRRTREHVIASMCVNFVERFVIDAGFTAERFIHDYGYDLSVTTYDANGYVEPGRICIQCKASDKLPDPAGVSEIPYRFDTRHLFHWSLEPMPVFVVYFDAKRRRGYWIHIQDFVARGLIGAEPSGAAPRFLLLKFPVANRMNASTVRHMRRCKDLTMGHAPGLRFSR